MENQGESVPVVVRSRSDLDKQSDGLIVVKGFGKSARMWRAIKALLICWFIAAFCILVPILHFVLVPAFLLVGVFMFFHQMSVTTHLISGSVRCPSCQNEMSLKPMAFDWPKREICTNCRSDLTLEKKS